MKFYKKGIIVTIYFLFFVLCSSLVWAIPMADVRYIEKELIDGRFQYDYFVTNKTPDTDPADDIWAVIFKYDFTVEVEVSSLPDGWFSDPWIGDPPIYGFVSTFSWDLPFDITPGMSLDGFSFILSKQVGNTGFEAAFTNSIPFEGVTAPVPEPATILLLASGMAGLGVFGRKRFRSPKA